MRNALVAEVERRRREGAGCDVVVVGIERFARTRAAFGYDLAADLAEACQKRILSVAPRASVHKLAPDVFGVSIPADGSGAPDQALPELICDAMRQPICLGAHRFRIVVRCGVARADRCDSTAHEQVADAELALDRARDEGRDFIVHLPGETDQPANRLCLLEELSGGLAAGEVIHYYQPQVNPRTGEVVGAEALMRWQSPRRGLVMPGQFIPMAEETGQIADLTEYGLRLALEHSEILLQHGYPVRLSVNMSSRLLTDRAFVDVALKLLEENGPRLTLEITETAVVSDWSIALHHLKLLASKGVRLAIDDYGSGMSSLGYLQLLPVQEVKIDRQFIKRLTSSHRDPLLVRSTIELGHALELEVVAEGIEDPHTLALLTMMGCDTVQGYFIGIPMQFDDFLAYLKAGSSRQRIESPRSPLRLFGGE
jgi:diguanylate cyclase